MGKGGGKCASRERSGSSVASRTPRLPAKPHHVTPHQSSAKAKDVDRAADTDSATLEPFIPKVCLSLFAIAFELYLRHFCVVMELWEFCVLLLVW
jgi:hypothetical protein